MNQPPFYPGRIYPEFYIPNPAFGSVGYDPSMEYDNFSVGSGNNQRQGRRKNRDGKRRDGQNRGRGQRSNRGRRNRDAKANAPDLPSLDSTAFPPLPSPKDVAGYTGFYHSYTSDEVFPPFLLLLIILLFSPFVVTFFASLILIQ